MLNARQSERLTSLLRDCDRHLPQGVVFIHADNADVRLAGQRLCAFCRRCLGDPATSGYCRRSILSGAHQALQTGEPYFFRCWVGLNSVVVPVAPAGKLGGAIETGGFFYTGQTEEDRSFVADSLHPMTRDSRAAIAANLAQVPTLSPLEARGMASFIFEALFAAGVNVPHRFQELHDRYTQQRRIGALMQDAGAGGQGGTDLFALFAALQPAIRAGDRHRIMLLMDGFFSRVMLSTALDPEQMKAHVHLLLAFMVRESVLLGRDSLAAGVARHYQALQELEQQHEPADICHWTSKRLSLFLDRLQDEQIPSTGLSRRVCMWIDQHFAGKATLAEAARSVGASPSTIVQALRRETRTPFHHHLTTARLREARRLLTLTDVPISDVASRCGFADQSHLTRCFRQRVGITPGRYRRLARVQA